MGRKKSVDPKQEIRIWIETSIIDNNGGLENAKLKIEKYLQEESKEKKILSKNL